MPQKPFSAWLRDELRRRDWDQAELSRRAKISSGRISEWVTGKRVPGPKVADRLADALGMDLVRLLRLTGTLPPDPFPDDQFRDDLIAVIRRSRWSDTPEQQRRALGLIAQIEAWREMDDAATAHRRERA